MIEINKTIFLTQDIPFILIFTSLHFIVPGYVEKIFHYNKLKLSEGSKIEWTNRIISTINAIFTFFLSFYCLMTQDSWINDSFSSTSLVSEFTIRFISYYFLYDTIVSILYHKYLFSWSITLHHLIGFLTFPYLGIYLKTAHPLTLYYIFTEFTTPFINARYFLLELKLKSSKLYTLNGLVILLGFVFIRDLYVPNAIWRIFHYYQGSAPPQLVVIFFYSVYPLITVLNLYWTFAIVKGFIKFFTSSPGNTKKNKAA